GGDAGARRLAIRTLIVFMALFSVFALNTFAAAPARRLDAGLSSPNAAGALFAASALLTLGSIVHSARRSTTPQPRALAWAQSILQSPLSTLAFLSCLGCALLSASRGAAFAAFIGAIAFTARLAFAPQKHQADAPPSRIGLLGLGLLVILL